MIDIPFAAIYTLSANIKGIYVLVLRVNTLPDTSEKVKVSSFIVIYLSLELICMSQKLNKTDKDVKHSNYIYIITLRVSMFLSYFITSVSFHFFAIFLRTSWNTSWISNSVIDFNNKYSTIYQKISSIIQKERLARRSNQRHMCYNS